MADRKISQNRPVTQNVLKYAKYKVFCFLKKCPISLETPYPMLDFVSVDNPTFYSPTSKLFFLTDSEERLMTFNASDWKLEFITPKQLSEAGFRYVGEPDRVICTFCSTEFGDWQQGDDPKVVHKQTSPQCPFFDKQPYQTIIDGMNNSPNCQIIRENIKKTLEVAGVVYQFRTAKDKNHANFACRLESFDVCHHKIKENAHTFCEAGFFYIGNGHNDHVSCFCCGLCLKDWEDGDEPWTTHAKFLPTCTYLLLSKGNDFVNAALILLQNENSVLNITTNATKRRPDLPEPPAQASNQVGKSISEGLQRLSLWPKNLKSIPNSILCKICRKEEMLVVSAFCGHILACIQCTLTLDLCPDCMKPIPAVIKVHVDISNEQDDNLKDPMLCKVCREEKMEAVFLICGHVCACHKCATKINECPVCSERFCASMVVRGLEG